MEAKNATDTAYKGGNYAQGGKYLSVKGASMLLRCGNILEKV